LHLARLARLRLDDEEVDRMTAELGAIVGYMGMLASADLTTADDEIDAIVPLSLREDEPGQGLDRDAALGQSARVARDGFVVRSFKEG
jgi:aspartyl-tRNA(Asn)/glutamyl-tRNA(Gln) amidotransferase subunit C